MTASIVTGRWLRAATHSLGRRRRAQAFWNDVKSLALVLAIFAVLIALTMALRFAIWLPLSHL